MNQFVATDKGYYYISFNKSPNDHELHVLSSLIGDFKVNTTSHVFIGTHPHIVTAWCSNAINILKKQDIYCIKRIEKFRISIKLQML